MPHASAVVCHGGSGTLLSTLATGCPVVVIPLFADQFANARSVDAAGAGLAAMSHKVDEIGQASGTVLTSRVHAGYLPDDSPYEEFAWEIKAEIPASESLPFIAR